ncbi:DUF1566 domain-containing protein [Viridibacterium curvum]|uniref:Lcl C-terminal domain-containing protein n=1 Tax=Viridibacterium curvum TaxID=1101404 RepID=A0ABP9QXN3_9RHOO
MTFARKPSFKAILIAFCATAAMATHAQPYWLHKSGTMVYDSSTGLVWARCSVGQQWNGDSCAGEAKDYQFEQAFDVVSRINSTGNLGGITNWALPNVRQLQSLRQCTAGFRPNTNIDLNDQLPPVPQECKRTKDDRYHIHPVAFPQSEALYWTSTPLAGSKHLAWSVGFSNGLLETMGRKLPFYLRLVRSMPLTGNPADAGFTQKLNIFPASPLTLDGR